MNRDKPHKRYEIVRTDSQVAEKSKNRKFLAARLMIIPTIVGLRRAEMDPLNIILIGSWVVWLLFDAVLTVEWKHPLVSKITKSIWLRATVVVVVAIPAIGFAIASYCKSPAQANAEILGAIKDVAERQTAELSKLRLELIKKVDDHLAKQPLGKKDKWREHLTEAYPLGWRMYATDGKETYAPPGLSYEKYFVVVWDSNGVSKLTPEWISLRPPDIFPRSGGLITRNTVTVRRQLGKELKLLRLGKMGITAEILEDEGDFIVFAIGFREATKAELLPPSQKAQRPPTKAIP